MEKQSISPRSIKKDKGVVGLTILLSVVAMVFVIGFLIMVFVIIGSQLQVQAVTSASGIATNESANGAKQASANASGYSPVNNPNNVVGFRNPAIFQAINESSGEVITANVSIDSNGTIKNATATQYNLINVTYTWGFDQNNTATQAIFSTNTAIAGTTAWFGIIITITVMVALILLTVIIIVAIRSSGILSGGQ